MLNIKELLPTVLSAVSTGFLGLLVYGGSIAIDHLFSLTSRTATIEINQSTNYSEQKGYQNLISNELNYIKKDVGSIKEVQKKYAEDVSSNTKKIDRMCTSMEYYWDKTNCK